MIEISERLSQILDCFILGMGYKETSEAVGLSKNTILYHLKKAKRINSMTTIQLVAEHVRRKVRARYECKGILDKGEL